MTLCRSSVGRIAVVRCVVVLVTVALGSAQGSSVSAQETGKLYAGVGLAMTNFDSDHDGIGYGDSALGWQLYGGLQARDRMAVEFALERFGGIESGDILGSGVDRLRISADYSSLAVRGVFSLSLEEVLRRRQKITLFATMGMARLLEERSALELGTSIATAVSERDTAFVLGAGVTFDIKRLRLRTYLQSADRGESSLNSVGAAAEFRF